MAEVASLPRSVEPKGSIPLSSTSGSPAFTPRMHPLLLEVRHVVPAGGIPSEPIVLYGQGSEGVTPASFPRRSAFPPFPASRAARRALRAAKTVERGERKLYRQPTDTDADSRERARLPSSDQRLRIVRFSGGLAATA